MPKFASESYFSINDSQSQSFGNNLALSHTRLIASPPSSASHTPTVVPQLSSRQARAARTPRPANAWIVFRRANVEGMVLQMEYEIARSSDPSVGVPQAEVSKRLGKIWNGLSAEEKKPYYDQAEIEKEEHARKYPDYRYAPLRSSKAKSARTYRPSHETISATRNFEHASPVRSSAPAPGTASAMHASTAAPLTMERDFDLFQDLFTAPELPQGPLFSEALQAVPTQQQTPDFGLDFMKWLEQPSPLDEKLSSIEDWSHLNTPENSSSNSFSVNPALNFTEQQDLCARAPYYQSSEVSACYDKATNLLYPFPTSFSIPSSAATTPESSIYPTSSPSPSHPEVNFQLNSWDALDFNFF